eukprot:CAMPEP_0184498972 /NCGR_PEP_ID=MMETSP0113_2-20130426/40317_1 /TAXON_ID=91329 /ORGANISM="Norrisiella sphaerica, Strain BC52" /LENGTH=61 /DNA_ID=CAMNT_0026886705 /DNA_START=31 /DNA_END=216 /DNA_ORIENTATION=-
MAATVMTVGVGIEERSAMLVGGLVGTKEGDTGQTDGTETTSEEEVHCFDGARAQNESQTSQ